MGDSQERDGAGGKRKKLDMGRSEWSRQTLDKRARNEEQEQAKRRKLEQGEAVDVPIYATTFSKEDIENEERRPKRKVAVLLGYAGTGYHGMQLSTTQKTIEGELFPAFVAAGAISKANAADPKKSSLVRCARTDKGVHAAGNVVSLKMIVEDPDIVQKINEKLSPQIRIWGIQTTNKSFSCYQMCDSRIYEYLIPSHSFLPPHPSTYLGRKLVELAEKQGDLEAYKKRQEEVGTFWQDVDTKYIKPILEDVPEDIRRIVQKALYFDDDSSVSTIETESMQRESSEEGPEAGTEPASSTEDAPESSIKPPSQPGASASTTEPSEDHTRQELITKTIKDIKAAYNAARRAWRIPTSRLTRLQATLDNYVGTKNFYNYTILKSHTDPSAKRHIKSFKVNPKPIIIDGTEWLSLKVHGQSFMMHQIRKMVAMATLIVRCGCDPRRIHDSYGPTKIGIPKAPGLGLLLERPIFDVWNKTAANLGRDPIDFSKYDKEILEFKQREIYDRIFREEERTNAFASFFNHVDNFPQEDFLYVTSGGIAAAKPPPTTAAPTTSLLDSVPSTDATEKSKVKRPTGRKSQREALAAVESASEDEDTVLPDGGEEGG